MKMIYLLILLFVYVYSEIQGQTVIYKYNTQGSCTSRVYANSTQKAHKNRKVSTTTNPIRLEVSPSTTFNDAIYISTVGKSTTNGLAYILANTSGQVVLKGTFTSKGVTLATSSLPDGVYILKVRGDNYNHSYKLLKK